MKNHTTAQYGLVKRGSELTQAKLNETLVRRIRAEHAQAQEEIRLIKERASSEAMAKSYGVHVRTIEHVLNYRTWRHVL